jgi:hypothetical protein
MQLNNFDILNAIVALLSFLIFSINWMTNKKPSLPNFLFRIFLLANSYYCINGFKCIWMNDDENHDLAIVGVLIPEHDKVG